jgi:hypothetical protein
VIASAFIAAESLKRARALSRIGERATEWFEEVAQHRLALTQLLPVIPVVRIGDIESQVAQRGVEHFAEHSDVCIIDVEIHGSRLGRPLPVRKSGVDEFVSGERQARGPQRMTSKTLRSVFQVALSSGLVPSQSHTERKISDPPPRRTVSVCRGLGGHTTLAGEKSA